MTQTTLMSERAVKAELGISSTTTVNKYVANELLPTPVNTGLRAKSYPASEIHAIKEARAAGADHDTIRALVRKLLQDRQHRLQAVLDSINDDRASHRCEGVPA